MAIIINDTINKSLDRVSCADCILDTEFPAHEPTTTKNCNPICGRLFGILLEHNNKAIFHARTVSKCELVHLYYVDNKPVALSTNSQQGITILDNLLTLVFPCNMQINITNC